MSNSPYRTNPDCTTLLTISDAPKINLWSFKYLKYILKCIWYGYKFRVINGRKFIQYNKFDIDKDHVNQFFIQLRKVSIELKQRNLEKLNQEKLAEESCDKIMHL